jgi:hypothetical protein
LLFEESGIRNGLSKKFDEALVFASELHWRQKRRGANTP